MNDDLTEYVVNTAKRIENMDSIEDYDDPLDVRIVASLDGTVREVITVESTGGPHIEINATKGTVSGSWGSDTHTTHVNNDDVLNQIHQRYSELFGL